MKKILLLSHRTAVTVASDLKQAERRRIDSVIYQLDKAIAIVNEIEFLINNRPSCEREKILYSKSVLHCRKKMLRIRVDMIFSFLDDLESYSPLLRNKINEAQWIALSVLRYQLPNQWGRLLSVAIVNGNHVALQETIF